MFLACLSSQGWGLFQGRDSVSFISTPTAQRHVGTEWARLSPDPNPCCWGRGKGSPSTPVWGHPRGLLCSPPDGLHIPGVSIPSSLPEMQVSKPETKGSVSSWLGPSCPDSPVPEAQASRGEPHLPSPSTYLLSTYSVATILLGVRDSVGTETWILALERLPF